MSFCRIKTIRISYSLKLISFGIFFFISVVLLLSTSYKGTKYSLFWRPDLDLLTSLEKERDDKSRQYLSSIKINPKWSLEDIIQRNNNNSSKICIGIITKPKNTKYNFLNQLLSSIHENMNEYQRSYIPIMIWAPFREEHIVDIEFLEKIGYQFLSREFVEKSIKQKIGSIKNYGQKINDFYSIFQFCSLCESSIILEDDMLVAPKFIQEVESIIQQNNTKCGIVQLFVSEYDQSWKIKHWYIIVPCILVGLALLKSFDYFMTSDRLLIHIIIFLYGFGITLFVLLAVNKQNILSGYSNGLYPIDYSAFSQAQLYSQNQMKSLIQYLEKLDTSQIPKELSLEWLLNLWIRQENREICGYFPNLFQHIGLLTTEPYLNYKLMKVSRTFPTDIFGGQNM